MSGDASVAYFVTLPFDEQQYLDPEFEGGTRDLTLDMQVDGHLFREVDLSGCFTYHVPVPPELLASVPTRIVVKSGAVAGLVGIKGGVVSGVINLESSGVEAPDWRPRHDKAYHEA
jgi:hypothetical protein